MDCAYHPGKEAITQCSTCGRPLCEECSKSPDTICIDCSILPSLAERGKVAGIHLVEWSGWRNSFIRPREAFKTNSGLYSLAGIAMNLLVGLIDAGIVAFLLVMIRNPLSGGNAGWGMGFFDYTTLYIIFLCIWLVTAVVSYFFALLLGGLGSLEQHLYLLSLPIPFSPFAILLLGEVLAVLISIHISIAVLAVILITVYIVNIWIIGLEEAHRLSSLQAAVSGIIPLSIMGAAVGLLILTFRR